jgi:uncharacterized protein with GYD domain
MGPAQGLVLINGQYGEMCIWEAPDAETGAKILIRLRPEYGGRTETLQAFSNAEAAALLAGME